jgi:hypothetical protein
MTHAEHKQQTVIYCLEDALKGYSLKVKGERLEVKGESLEVKGERGEKENGDGN